MSSDEWQKTTLDNVVNIVSGGTPSTTVPEYWSDEVKWATAKDVSESSGYKIYDSERKISTLGLENCPASIVPKYSTVLIARGATMGKSCMLGEDMAINQTCYALVAKKGKINPHFLFYSIKYLYEYFQKIAHGAIFNTVIGSGLRETEISLPPLPTQRSIVEILSALDDKIELNRQTNATLEAIAQAIFKEWFVDFNFPGASGEMVESELGLIPKGWRAGTLEDIVNNFDRKRIPLSSREREERKGIYPYYGATSILDYVDDYLFDGVYLLMGEDGTVVTDDDKPVLQYVSGKFWVNNHAHVLQGRNPFSTEYVYILLSNTNIRHVVTGAVQPKINQQNMNGLVVTLPDNMILNRFQEIIKPIFTNILLFERQTSALASLRDILLPKLMSGSIEV
ncbi:MAG: restriction endonuclease subunit S [Anaerolineales bacterium]|nr:restriction endonuclease subunit S [Anaerolineales bacterium]